MSTSGGDRPILEVLTGESSGSSDEVEAIETPVTNTRKRKRLQVTKKTISIAWVDFERIPKVEDYAKCLHCGKKISCKTVNGTRAMLNHANRYKKKPGNFVDRTQTLLDFESKTKVSDDGTLETVNAPRLWRFNQEDIRKALARMLLVDELPFSFVEREGFNHFCKIAVPDFVLPSRTTATRDCYGIFIDNRIQLKNFIANLSSRVCLTTDTWTSGQNLSYMCLNMCGAKRV